MNNAIKYVKSIFILFLSTQAHILHAAFQPPPPHKASEAPAHPSSNQTQAPELSAEKLWDLVDQHMKKIDLSDLANKVLVFIIGNTGTGKSTTTNILLGHPYFTSKGDDDDTIIYTKKSKRINSYARTSNKVYPQTTIPSLYKDEKSGICYLDCPGFRDTRGDTQQVFNSMLIRSCIEHCGKVGKIVYVFEKNSMIGARGEEFKAAIKHFSEWFHSINDLLPNIIWLFNKYKKGNKSTVIKHIEKIRNGKDTEPSVKKLLKEITEKYSDNIAMISNPIKPNKEKLLALIKAPTQGISKASFKKQVQLRGKDQTAKIKQYLVELAKNYNDKMTMEAVIREGEEELARCNEIIDTPGSIESQLNLLSEVNKDKIEKKKSNIASIQNELNNLRVHGDEEHPIPKIRELLLSAYVMGNSGTIHYNDAPFIRTEIENIENRCTVEVRRNVPSLGEYIADCTLPVNWHKLGKTASLSLLTAAAPAAAAAAAPVAAAAAAAAATTVTTAAATTVVTTAAATAVTTAAAKTTAEATKRVRTYLGLGNESLLKSILSLKKDQGYVQVRFFLKKSVVQAGEIQNKEQQIQNERASIQQLTNENQQISNQLASRSGANPQLQSRVIQKGIRLLEEIKNDLKRAKESHIRKRDRFISQGANNKYRLAFLFYTYPLLYQNKAHIDHNLKLFEQNCSAHEITYQVEPASDDHIAGESEGCLSKLFSGLRSWSCLLPLSVGILASGIMLMNSKNL